MRTYRCIPLYYFYWSLCNYAAHAADILTPTTVVQGVDNHSWDLYCHRCYCIHVCWGRSNRIFHFSRWLCQLSTILTKDESPHTGYTFTPLGGASRAVRLATAMDVRAKLLIRVKLSDHIVSYQMVLTMAVRTYLSRSLLILHITVILLYAFYIVSCILSNKHFRAGVRVRVRV